MQNVKKIFMRAVHFIIWLSFAVIFTRVTVLLFCFLSCFLYNVVWSVCIEHKSAKQLLMMSFYMLASFMISKNNSLPAAWPTDFEVMAMALLGS